MQLLFTYVRYRLCMLTNGVIFLWRGIIWLEWLSQSEVVVAEVSVVVQGGERNILPFNAIEGVPNEVFSRGVQGGEGALGEARDSSSDIRELHRLGPSRNHVAWWSLWSWLRLKGHLGPRNVGSRGRRQSLSIARGGLVGGVGCGGIITGCVLKGGGLRGWRAVGVAERGNKFVAGCLWSVSVPLTGKWDQAASTRTHCFWVSTRPRRRRRVVVVVRLVHNIVGLGGHSAVPTTSTTIQRGVIHYLSGLWGWRLLLLLLNELRKGVTTRRNQLESGKTLEEGRDGGGHVVSNGGEHGGVCDSKLVSSQQGVGWVVEMGRRGHDRRGVVELGRDGSGCGGCGHTQSRLHVVVQLWSDVPAIVAIRAYFLRPLHRRAGRNGLSIRGVRIREGFRVRDPPVWRVNDFRRRTSTTLAQWRNGIGRWLVMLIRRDDLKTTVMRVVVILRSVSERCDGFWNVLIFYFRCDIVAAWNFTPCSVMPNIVDGADLVELLETARLEVDGRRGGRIWFSRLRTREVRVLWIVLSSGREGVGFLACCDDTRRGELRLDCLRIPPAPVVVEFWVKKSVDDLRPSLELGHSDGG